MNMTVTGQLADFALSVTCDDLPPSTVLASKLLMLDTIGCAIGALATDEGRAVCAIAQSSGGEGSASVLGTRLKVPMQTAAWANGRLGNILDMDECYKVQGHHAQASLGAALALAESGGRDGKSLLSAFTMGFETGVRLGNFLSPRVTIDENGRTKGWTGLVGPGQGVLAACTATARLAGLSREALADAYGNCAQYMVGRDWSRQWGRDENLGTMKYADTGWNAHGGMMAAWHAREGVRGISDIFDSDSYAQVFQGVILDRDAMLRGMGSEWYLPETSIKFWPCCRWIHYALTAFSDVVRENGLRPEDIERVDLRSFPMIPYPRFALQSGPPNLVAATFSFAHAAAMVALDVPAGPAWFTKDNLFGDIANAMRERITLSVDERGYDPDTWGLDEGVLRVPSSALIHAGGRQFEAFSDFALGDSWAGAPDFDETDITAKFHRLMQAGASAPDKCEDLIDQVIHTVLNIDQLEDVRDLTHLLQTLAPSAERRTISTANAQ